MVFVVITSRELVIDMKCVLRLATGKNGALRLVRCPECGEPRLFPSFKQAREFAESKAVTLRSVKKTKWRITRIKTCRVP